MPFCFIDPGPLIDRELQLVAPDIRYVDDMLAACEHPLARGDAQAQNTSREKLIDFLRAAPQGRHPGDRDRGLVPAYHFWMKLSVPDPHIDDPPSWRMGEPPIRIAGGIGLRIGYTRDIELYYGHIGYSVLTPVRGNHYAERACRLLLPLARAHGMSTLWITCNPDNIASRRTCERLGCALVGVVRLPVDNPLYLRGEREKCRFRLDL